MTAHDAEFAAELDNALDITSAFWGWVWRLFH